MSDVGINFRSTSGFVTDGTNETYCRAADAYPTSRGGFTLGWEGTANGSVDRDNTLDRRIAGNNFVNAGTGIIWRLDIPAGAGTYLVEIGQGDDDPGNQPASDLLVVDDATTKITLSADPAPDQYLDATNTIHTSGANWATNQTAVEVTFASSIARISLRSSAALTHRVNHFALTAVAGSVSRIPVIRQNYRNMGY